MLILSIILGIAVFYFFKSYGLIAIVVSGLVAGVIAKGPIGGLMAGFTVAFLSAVVFLIPIPSPLEIFGLATSVTGYSIAEIDPFKLTISIFSISGVLAGTIAGLVGGVIRR